jgi:hypothetical protein
VPRWARGQSCSRRSGEQDHYARGGGGQRNAGRRGRALRKMPRSVSGPYPPKIHERFKAPDEDSGRRLLTPRRICPVRGEGAVVRCMSDPGTAARRTDPYGISVIEFVLSCRLLGLERTWSDC